MITLWLLACASVGSQRDAPPPPAEEPAAPSAAAPATEDKPATPTLPADYRTCATDDDCVVAWALAGLDHLPAEGESCKAECVVGVSKGAAEAWQEAVKALAAGVPCDLEMEPCPPLSAWTARCVEGTCTTEYVGD